MTLSDIKRRVRVYLGDQGAMRFGDALVTEITNPTLRYLWQKIKSRNPDWTQKSVSLSTVQDSDSITTNFPVDFGALTRLEYTSDKVPLERWRWPEEDALTGTGKPLEFRMEKGKIVFRQKADAVYGMTLWYEMIVPILSAEADVHALPEFFDQVIIQRGALVLGV